MALLGPNGAPIATSDYARRKKGFPQVGEVAPGWAAPPQQRGIRLGPDNQLQFDTSRLTLDDYRLMRDHYQVNSSLTVLTFMLHQLEWKIEHDDPKVVDHVTENLSLIWTRLVRAMSQAFIFGYSPNALQWENEGNKVMLTKIKDLRPEECRVRWKQVSSVGRTKNRPAPKANIYDGIIHQGFPDIPVENSVWYPLLMENSNMYGRKILNAAFQPWFFSNLIHMYANRYFERFGEPVVIGRAPFDETINVGGQEVEGNVLMSGLISMVRNGSSIVAPNSRAMNGLDGVANYEYTFEYLESMMRGADWERHLTRLDQEISLALFTPLLMMNSVEGGSYNLGVVHTQMYLGMINAVAGDWKEYIDRYIIRPMTLINFGPKVDPPRWKFRRLGQTKEETVRTVLNSLLNTGNGDKLVKVDLEDLGQEIGLSLTEIDDVRRERDDEGDDSGPGYTDPKVKKDKARSAGGRPGKQRDTRVGRPEREKRGKGTEKSGISLSIADRVGQQMVRAMRDGEREFSPDIGHARQIAEHCSEGEAKMLAEMAPRWIGAYYEAVRSDPPSPDEIRRALREGLSAHLEPSDA